MYAKVLCAALLVFVAHETQSAHARPQSKLQGVFTTVRRMPATSPLAAPSNLGSKSNSAHALRATSATGKVTISSHNLPEPPQQEPVFSSEPDGGTEDMLPFYEGEPSGDAGGSPEGVAS